MKTNKVVNTDEVLVELAGLCSYGMLVPSGSHFICGTMDTDVDFFLVRTSSLENYLKSRGYSCNFKENYFDDAGVPINKEDSHFFSYRKGYFNVVLVQNKEDLKNIELATDLCRELNLTKKDDRILVFRALRYRSLDKTSKTGSTTKELTKQSSTDIYDQTYKFLREDLIPF